MNTEGVSSVREREREREREMEEMQGEGGPTSEKRDKRKGEGRAMKS